jgi:copper(I)-binding protein
MSRRTTLAASILILATLVGPTIAQQPAVTPAGVTVHDAWARATPTGAAVGAAYMTLTSPTGDVLTGASTTAASHAAVHEMQMDGAVMQMRAIEGGLALPPGQAVTLRPGGLHVMLEGLRAPLKQGGTVPLHLTFRTAPPLDLQVPVRAIGAAGPGSAPAGQGAMPGMGK